MTAVYQSLAHYCFAVCQTLENYRKEWENAHTVTVSVSAMPTKRANASLCPDPKDSSTLWLFGGESMIGDDWCATGSSSCEANLTSW